VAGARELSPPAWVNGPEEPEAVLPNTANLSFPGLEADFLVQALDLEGIAVSAGSACTSGALEPSGVLAAMNLPAWRSRSAVRVSLGRDTRPEDVDRLLTVLREILGRTERSRGA
jgi:cysteine desulfurase